MKVTIEKRDGHYVVNYEVSHVTAAGGSGPIESISDMITFVADLFSDDTVNSVIFSLTPEVKDDKESK